MRVNAKGKCGRAFQTQTSFPSWWRERKMTSIVPLWIRGIPIQNTTKTKLQSKSRLFPCKKRKSCKNSTKFLGKLWKTLSLFTDHLNFSDLPAHNSKDITILWISLEIYWKSTAGRKVSEISLVLLLGG